MRPTLVEIPAKLLFFVALVLAGISFFRERKAIQIRAAAAKAPPGEAPAKLPPPPAQNWLFLLLAAYGLMAFRGGSYIPTAELFKAPWLPLPIFSYGVMLGTSMIIGWFLAMRLSKADGVPTDAAGAIYMWTAVWSIIGARILYIIVQWREFDGLLDVFKIWKGGLVAYGGMIGGFLASWYNCRRRKIPLLRWADVSAPSVVLGTGITRVGCLLFGCDYGRRTDLPWGLHFPVGAPAWEDHIKNGWIDVRATSSLSVHPTQIYEMIAALSIFAVVMYLRKVRKFSGLPFVGWVVGYGILRPVIEIYRDDDQRGGAAGLSTSQIIGITATILGLSLLAVLLKRYKADPAGSRLWELDR